MKLPNKSNNSANRKTIVIVNNTSIYVVRFRRELIDTLVSNGFDVVLIAPRDRASEEFSSWPMRWVEWPLSQYGMNPLREFLAILFLRNILKQLCPYAVLNFTLKPAIYGSIAARITKCQNIFSVFTGLGHYFVDDGNSKNFATLFVKLLLRFALKNNNRVVFQNNDDLKLFTSLGIVDSFRTCRMNGSGVNVCHFRPVPMPKKIAFIFIGRLRREKGIYEYVEAAKLIKTLGYTVRFIVIGAIGQESTAVQLNELDQWQRDGYIEYFGEINDVRPLIAQASALVLPSFYREGVPRSALEAMSMGRALIVSDTPGCRDTIEGDSNGLKVPAKDANTLMHAMLEFINDPERVTQMGLESRRIACEKFEVFSVTNKLLEDLGLVEKKLV